MPRLTCYINTNSDMHTYEVLAKHTSCASIQIQRFRLFKLASQYVRSSML